MGKISEFNIYLSGNRQVFYPGEKLYGEVVLNTHQPMKMNGLYVECQGKAECHWTEQEGTGDNRHTEHYRGKEILFEYKISLFNQNVHPQGRYVYPFSFTLPSLLPSSFEGPHGHIRYDVKAEIKKSFIMKNHKVKYPFSINEILDVNQPHYQQGPGGQQHKEVGCCCCVAGPLDVTASIDRAAYCPGEVILIDANVQNNTTRNMSALKAKLYREVIYQSSRKAKTYSQVITRIDGPPIEKGKFALWERQPFGIPATPPTITNRIIRVHYHVEVQVDVPWGIDLAIKLPITMGTVPFRLTYQAQQQYTFSPEQTGFQASYATAPPPPMNILGYPDMAPPSYASAVGDTQVNIADEDGKTHGTSSYIPVYTFARPFQGAVPPISEIPNNPQEGASYPPGYPYAPPGAPEMLPQAPNASYPAQLVQPFHPPASQQSQEAMYPPPVASAPHPSVPPAW